MQFLIMVLVFVYINIYTKSLVFYIVFSKFLAAINWFGEVTHMAKFNHHHRLLPGMKPRPEVVLVDKNDEEEKLKSESSATFLLIKNCSNYSLIWYGKVAKIMCENCRNLKIVLSESPITGTVEVYKSKTVVVGLTQFCQVIGIQSLHFSNLLVINIFLISSLDFYTASTIVIILCLIQLQF